MSVLTALRKLLPTGKLFRDVLALAGGTAVAQIILISTSPFLTRLFSPADFGMLSVFAATVGILGVVVSWRYEFAIPIAKSDEEAANLLILSILLSGLTSAGVSVAVYIWREQFARWSNTPELSSYIWLIPLALFAIGIFQAINYWLTRKKAFTQVGLAKVYQSAIQAVIQLVSGALSLGAIGLILGYILGRVSAAVHLLSRLKLDLRLLSLRGIYFVANRYKKFPLFTAWASLINVVGTQAPVIMFAKLFSTEVAGLFSLTVRMLGLPAALLGQAVGQALYPRLAEKVKQSDAPSKMIGDAALLLFMVAFPIFVFIGAYGPTLFALIFGPDWQQAGVYARYLSPWLLLSFLSSPLSMFVYVKEQQGMAFMITIYETAIRIGSIWVGGEIGSPEWAVILYAVAGIMISIVYIVWVFRLAQLSLYSWAIQHKHHFLSTAFVFTLVLIMASDQGYLSVISGGVVLSCHFCLWAYRYRGLFHA